MQKNKLADKDLNNIVKEKNTFLIFYKKGCPFCINAEEIIESKGYKLKKLVLGEDFTQQEFKNSFKQSPTYPQIWLGEDYIGGCDDLKYIFEN